MLLLLARFVGDPRQLALLDRRQLKLLLVLLPLLAQVEFVVVVILVFGVQVRFPHCAGVLLLLFDFIRSIIINADIRVEGLGALVVLDQVRGAAHHQLVVLDQHVHP